MTLKMTSHCWYVCDAPGCSASTDADAKDFPDWSVIDLAGDHCPEHKPHNLERQVQPDAKIMNSRSLINEP